MCQAYADPEVYDIAFSFRNFEQEVCKQRMHGAKRPLQVSEGAAGEGPQRPLKQPVPGHTPLAGGLPPCSLPGALQRTAQDDG